MRALQALIILTAVAGCAADRPAPPATDQQGIAELRVDAGPLVIFGITRVTAEAAGQSAELAFDDNNATYAGTLILPSGTQSLIVRAFNGDAEVGKSQPTPVDVVTGAVIRVMLQIFDTRHDQPPTFGPLFDSLTFPTTAQAGDVATFALSVIAPAGDPVSYAWGSDCPDATFTASGGAITGWSKPTQGVCAVSVTATSNGFAISRSFSIVVFPAGASGAVEIVAGFVFAPAISLQVPGVGCFDSSDPNSSCPDPIASPSVSFFQVVVPGWGGSSPGSLELTDNCGGHIGFTFQGTDSLSGAWLPPIDAGVCILTARAVSAAGAVASRAVAILVHAGTTPQPQPPEIGASLDGCVLQPGTPADCGTLFAGQTLFLGGSVNWHDGNQGEPVAIEDSCIGPLSTPGFSSFFLSWSVPSLPTATCTVTVTAINLQGQVTQSSALYHVFGT